MALHRTPSPELMPVLSRGKHRSPRRGACFMELASYLAGEPWSDHPACTHPLLAGLARAVNDYTTDAGRSRLAGLIPSVIGLNSDDPRIHGRIALRSAIVALPVVSAERQRIMAVSILACERVLAGHDGRPAGEVSATSRAALDQVPHAAQWATHFAKAVRTSTRSFTRHGAPSIVRFAVDGIAHAVVPDPDARLRALLVAAIAECGGTVPAERPAAGRSAPVDVDPVQWTAACRLTGVN